MRCSRCEKESENPLFCSHCGAQLSGPVGAARQTDDQPRRSIGLLRARRVWAPTNPLLWFGLAFGALHVGAWLILPSLASFWGDLGIVCGVAFVVGLLVGVLRVATPMDIEALGEVVAVPSTLPDRSAPILFLAVFFGMIGTPVAGLIYYLIHASARECVDGRVVLVFGLTILSGLVFASHFALSFFLVRWSLGLMLPSMMLGWAFSSFFRSDAW